MSFLDGLITFGKTAVQFLSGNTIASTLVKTVGLALVINKLSKSAIANNNTDNDANIDQGVRLQIPPAADNKIPVLYGEAYFGGIITDAVMTNTNKTMYYCLTLSEKTGTKLSSGQASTYTFKDIYWNDQRIVFNADGITANYTVDRSGTVDTSISNLVQIWCYAGGIANQSIPENYTNSTSTNASTIMPGWTTSTHLMNDLIFSIVKVDYNRDKNITGIGNMVFQIENSMNLPGDVLYDYMSNERYGAGIPTAEILSQ
jgi:hypothetical protein